MTATNQYFQLIERTGNAFLKIIPARGGKELDPREVLDYLASLNYMQFNMRELSSAIAQNRMIVNVHVGAWSGVHQKERMKLSVSPDKMLVHATFYSPSNEGEVLTEEEIVNELKANGIVLGIQEEAIRQFVENREYCKRLLLAKGETPVTGSDGKVEYMFDFTRKRKPKKNADGSVNYRELNSINFVEPGQCLAQMIPETVGESGLTVYGEEIVPKVTKPAKFSYAANGNVIVSPDGLQLLAAVAGHVSLKEGKVTVAAVYEVPGDVDNSTGNIRYEGSVVIKGNVTSGFQVEAKGDIMVDGIVEDADLISDGQVVVKGGIHGMGKGSITAGSNVITKFIESATVKSGGYVETEAILFSNVSAKSDVRVGGRKGLISGGLVRAGNTIEAKAIGSGMGSNTRVEVGVEPKMREEYNRLQEEYRHLCKDTEMIRPILKNYAEKTVRKERIDPEITMQVQRLAKEFRGKNQRLAQIQDELKDLSEYITMENSANVRALGEIHSGVYVGISDIGMTLRRDYTRSKFVKSGGEIVISAL